MSDHDHLSKLPEPGKALRMGYKSWVVAEPEFPYRQTVYDVHEHDSGTLTWHRRQPSQLDG